MHIVFKVIESKGDYNNVLNLYTPQGVYMLRLISYIDSFITTALLLM